ncbi:MAG: o-succinylbenzoate synthase [Acidimicrobiia bacterium]|nr:o-succinylbenzoate synthase [Acidimicrobiia bacterium]
MSRSASVRPVEIELRRLEVPLVEPIVAAHGTESVRRVVVVRATADDGIDGWGECDALARPTYTSEWHEGAWLVLRDLLAPAAVAGIDAGVTGHPMAMAAIEGALVDLRLRREGRSLAVELGASRRRIHSRAVLGMVGNGVGGDMSGPSAIDQLLAAVAERLADGHRSVKLKVRPGWDLEPLSAVRATWPDLDLAADANGSYRAGVDDDHLVGLDRLELAYLEQPLSAADLIGHAALRRRIATPVALDESITGPESLRIALDLGALDVVNVKPARVGGIGPSTSLHRVVVDHGIGAFCGGMYELGIGRSVALAVAAMPGFGSPADLGPTRRYVATDITPPLDLDREGSLAVPAGPGVGPVPDARRLDEVTVERCVVRPV